MVITRIIVGINYNTRMKQVICLSQWAFDISVKASNQVTTLHYQKHCVIQTDEH